MQKKIIIISTFYKDTENSRGNLVYKYFKEANYITKVICSDFSHSKKIKEIYKESSDLIIIETKEYKKNISLKRIYSHIKFAFDSIKILKQEKCDLVYVILPPNILGYLVSNYCKKNKIKVIVDIIDLWPEALPIPKKIKILLDKTLNIFWKNLREKSIRKADYIITESNYFYEKMNLKRYLNSKVIFLKKVTKNKVDQRSEVNDDIIKIAYLGNIGKIYDFKSLIEISKKLTQQRKIILEIIGIGEEKDFLIQELEKNKIRYNFYGPIYDEEEKSKILGKCNFGFNGYKNITEVALSYKSIDYFSYGLPIINSAKGDTWKMIEKEKVGINYTIVDDKLIEDILNYKEKNILNFFKKNFSYESLKIDMKDVLKKIKI